MKKSELKALIREVIEEAMGGKEYFIDEQNMCVRDDVAQKIIGLPTTKIQGNGKPNDFREGDRAFFTSVKLPYKDTNETYNVDIFLKRYEGDTGHEGCSFIVGAKSKYKAFEYNYDDKYMEKFTEAEKQRIFDHASDFIYKASRKQ